MANIDDLVTLNYYHEMSDPVVKFHDPDRTSAIRYIENHHKTLELRRDFLAQETKSDIELPDQVSPGSLTGNGNLGSKAPVPTFSWSRDNGHSLVSIIYMGERLQGHPSIIHGGYIATLLDEALVRCCTNALGNLAVTASLTIHYKTAVRVRSYVLVTAKVAKLEGRRAYAEARIESLEEPRVVHTLCSGLFVLPKNLKMKVDTRTNPTL